MTGAQPGMRDLDPRRDRRRPLDRRADRDRRRRRSPVRLLILNRCCGDVLALISWLLYETRERTGYARQAAQRETGQERAGKDPNRRDRVHRPVPGDQGDC